MKDTNLDPAGDEHMNEGAESTLRMKFLETQYELKVKQAVDATKLYFQSIVVLGAGVAAGVTALATVREWQGAVTTVVFGGMPFFLLCWFGCFLFVYWDHHMMRISLDYSDKMASDLLCIGSGNVYLYHEDFLGVFNQADFPPKPIWSPVRVKSVQIVFIAIGLPGVLIFGYCSFKAFLRISQTHGVFAGWLYVASLAVLLITLVAIHLQCVMRERRLKRHLGIASIWADSRV